jgi:hypothetical protein
MMQELTSGIFDGDISDEISKQCEQRGFVSTVANSRCSVASRERFFTDGKQTVRIIVASFFGTFTQVEIYSCS